MKYKRGREMGIWVGYLGDEGKKKEIEMWIVMRGRLYTVRKYCRSRTVRE